MGKLVVIWSPVRSQGSSTVASSIASLMALETSNKVLFTHSKKSKTVLDSLYKTAATDLTKSGMEGLERLVKSGLLTPESIEDYTDAIYKGKLYYLQSNYKNEESDYDNAKSLFSVLKHAIKTFEITVVNVSSDSNSVATQQLLKQADSVIITLPQNNYAVEAFLNGDSSLKEMKDKKNTIMVIANYDEKANYTIRNIKRKNQLKGPVYAFPYTTELKNAINSESLSDFYFRSLESKKGSNTNNLIDSIRIINTELLKQLNLKNDSLAVAGVEYE